MTTPATEDGEHRLTESFDEAIDERERGGNTLIAADEDFEDVRTVAVAERVPEQGVSSFKVLPGRLKSDTFLGAYKCEGVEIL